MGKRLNRSVLFLGKKDDAHCLSALRFIESNFDDVISRLGGWGEPFPADVKDWEGEYVISYLSRWVVPEAVINNAAMAAINFHPASPEYPGIGCNNFALYDNAPEYGVTCHHMAREVDTGGIIAVKRFPIFPTDSVATLLDRTYQFQLVLFYEVIGRIIKGDPLPRSSETWKRQPFTRSEFNRLGLIDPEMSDEEIARRIRATSFSPWQPRIEINGHTFELKP